MLTKCLHNTVIVVALLTLGQQMHAQDSENFQWFQFYVEKGLGTTFSLKADAGYRFRSTFEEASQYITRTSIGAKLEGIGTVSAGFAHLGFLSSSSINRYEWRPHVLLSTLQFTERIVLKHRLRVEYRQFRDVIASGERTPNLSNRWRPRYRIMALLPITNTAWQLSIGNEMMFHVTPSLDEISFNQNRILLSSEYAIKESTSVLFTMNFQQTARLNDAIRKDYVFWFAIRHKIDST